MPATVFLVQSKMKKFFALILAVVLMVALCACKEPCQHEYKATAYYKNCADGGVKTMSCTKCNYAYAEALPAIEHSMDGWLYFDEATDFTPGVEKNVCGNCEYTETRLDYSRMFRNYAHIIRWLPEFSDPAQLQAFGVEGLNVISAAYFNGISAEQVSAEGEFPYVFRIHGVDLDEFTTKVFGMTYDYTGVENLNVLHESRCSYNADNNSLYITAYGAGNETPELASLEYTTEDDVHFTVTALWRYSEGGEFTTTFTVEKVGENYIIASK